MSAHSYCPVDSSHYYFVSMILEGFLFFYFLQAQYGIDRLEGWKKDIRDCIYVFLSLLFVN